MDNFGGVGLQACCWPWRSLRSRISHHPLSHPCRQASFQASLKSRRTWDGKEFGFPVNIWHPFGNYTQCSAPCQGPTGCIMFYEALKSLIVFKMWNASIPPPTELVTNKNSICYMNIKPILTTATPTQRQGGFGSHLPSWQICGSQKTLGKSCR